MGHGHDFGPPFVDGVGAFYIILACLWTALVVGGLVMLHGQRHSVAIRIRNFPLLASSIVMIHVYVLAVLLVYPLNGAFKCGGEFWIMSTILPFGFALFQGWWCPASVVVVVVVVRSQLTRSL